ncbi:V-type proton ATPase subunit e [Athalia rosae]|uniref:V-type proton ATPase subunit e n=1 Tax=Athalia rosae TaxID=37344 RepID=UPI00062611D5|nr:V-type proton ATPase subunit e [Athalia rosae]
MAASPISVVLFTLIWGVVGIVLPFLVPRGPNRGILQAILMLTAATCWLFWVCCYMAQMNPLIGPKVSTHTLLLMAREWGSAVDI